VIAQTESNKGEIEIDNLPARLGQDLFKLQELLLQGSNARRSATKDYAPSSTRSRTSVDLRPPSPPVPDLTVPRDADEKMVQEVGTQLFDFLFQRTIREIFDEEYKTATGNGQYLFIMLDIQHPDLSYLPWETLYHQTKRFYISTTPFTPFARNLDIDDGFKVMPAGRPLHALIMAARVKTLGRIVLDEIDVDGEQFLMKKAFSNIGNERITPRWVPSARARDLIRLLNRGDEGKRWDIMHFIGHGGFDSDRIQGYIVLQEDGGSGGIRCYSQSLREFLIQPERTPSLVVLNSCSGARSEPGRMFSSTAEDLIQGGIPAVVAMQFEVSEEMSLAFSEAFYTYLTDGMPIQNALVLTRAELKARGFSEWISPVLYLRTADGNVMQFSI
jgi:hypothetical protein